MCEAQYYAEKTSLFSGLMCCAPQRMNYFRAKPEFIISDFIIASESAQLAMNYPLQNEASSEDLCS